MKDIYQIIPGFLSKHKSAALCIVTDTEGSTPRKRGSKMLVALDGTTAGTVGGGAIEQQVIETAKQVIKTHKSHKKFYSLEDDLSMQCGGNVEVYIEPLVPRARLYIFGAGHVGKALSLFAHKLDFEVTLLDFRNISFSEEEQQTLRFIHGDYLQTLEQLEYDDNTYIVIMSPSHEDDFGLLSRLGKKSFAYLGMIGSKRKVARARERFLEDQTFTEEELNSFDMPMGIKIATETPEEIAISVLGKLIDVRNQKL